MLLIQSSCSYIRERKQPTSFLSCPYFPFYAAFGMQFLNHSQSDIYSCISRHSLSPHSVLLPCEAYSKPWNEMNTNHIQVLVTSEFLLIGIPGRERNPIHSFLALLVSLPWHWRALLYLIDQSPLLSLGFKSACSLIHFQNTLHLVSSDWCLH